MVTVYNSHLYYLVLLSVVDYIHYSLPILLLNYYRITIILLFSSRMSEGDMTLFECK